MSDTSRYQIGLAALRLGLTKPSNLDISKIAVPLMRELSEDGDMPIDMFMPVGEELLCFEISRKEGQITSSRTGRGSSGAGVDLRLGASPWQQT